MGNERRQRTKKLAKKKDKNDEGSVIRVQFSTLVSTRLLTQNFTTTGKSRLPT
jgi:hypothetical protein